MKIIKTPERPLRRGRPSRKTELNRQTRGRGNVVDAALEFVDGEAQWLDKLFDEAEELVDRKRGMREAFTANKGPAGTDLELLVDSVIDTRDFLIKRSDEMDARIRHCERLIKGLDKIHRSNRDAE